MQSESMYIQLQTKEELIQIIKDEAQAQLDAAYGEFCDNGECEVYDEETGLITIDLSFVDTSLMTDMSEVFNQALGWMNSDLVIEFEMFEGYYFKIDNWDVSNVTNMSGMFEDLEFEADLSEWDVSNVINMCGMFSGCGRFNSDLSGWNTSKVEDMYGMFHENYCFDADAITNWDTSGLKDKGDFENVLEELEMC